MILPQALTSSPAWRSLTWPCRSIIDFLSDEHQNHGGAENGRLLAPYAQLVQFGMARRDIRPALDMLEAFGIVACSTRGERLGGKTAPSTYRLTWLPTADGQHPTEEFKAVTMSRVEAYKAAVEADRSAKRVRKVLK